MKKIACTACSSRTACIALAAVVASMTQSAFADIAITGAKANGSEMGALTLKEMLESGQVIMVKSSGYIAFGIPNGDSITQKAAAAHQKANLPPAPRIGIASALANTAKKFINPAWRGATGTAKRALERAGAYFAKAGADGHYTGTGMAAIGA